MGPAAACRHSDPGRQIMLTRTTVTATADSSTFQKLYDASVTFTHFSWVDIVTNVHFIDRKAELQRSWIAWSHSVKVTEPGFEPSAHALATVFQGLSVLSCIY